MSDNADVTALCGKLNAYNIHIPDDELVELAGSYVALRSAAQRVLAAQPEALDIAVTFDPSAS